MDGYGQTDGRTLANIVLCIVSGSSKSVNANPNDDTNAILYYSSVQYPKKVGYSRIAASLRHVASVYL